MRRGVCTSTLEHLRDGIHPPQHEHRKTEGLGELDLRPKCWERPKRTVGLKSNTRVRELALAFEVTIRMLRSGRQCEPSNPTPAPQAKVNRDMAQAFAVTKASPGLLTVRLNGRIGQAQWEEMLAEVAKLLPEASSSSILVLAEDFQGWGAGEWDDASFRHDYDRRIDRMAIVADKEWEDQALMFAGKGLRRIEIEFFTPGEIARARRWLESSPQGPLS
jgi:hypothetical protein